MKEYDARTGRQKNNKGVTPTPQQDEFPGHLRVYFPSRDTVRHSRGGTNVSLKHLAPQTWLQIATVLHRLTDTLSLLARSHFIPNGGMQSRFLPKSSETARISGQVS